MSNADPGIDYDKDQLKQLRSTAKGNVTRKANKLNELINSNAEIDVVKGASQELHEVWSQFQLAHSDYHKSIKDEQAIEESKVYSDSVEELFSELHQRVNSWLERPTDESQSHELIQPEKQIQPEDSVSSVGSRRSSRAHSRTSSLRSTLSAKARAAALEAKANALQKIHELQLEELKIQQMKSRVQLQAEIDAVEAEKKVYEQIEVEEIQSQGFRQQNTVEQRPLPTLPQNTTPSPQRLEKISENNLEQQQPKKDPGVIPSTERPLNPSASQWSPNMVPCSKQATTHAGDNAFQQLMETQGRQSVALQQLVQNQQQSVMALTLPQPTIKVFTGDPMDYSDFIRGFEHLVEEKTPCPSSRLYYLVQYTSGPVQDLMKGCLSMKNEEGYKEARRLLKERYGQNYRIAAAYVQALTEGLPIKSEDGEALLKFSVQLTSCTNTLKEIGCLGKLDHPENLRRIVNRLPFGMRLKWRDAVDRIVENEGRDVTVKDITDFVTVKARAATHPVFGKVVNESKARQANEGQRPRFGNRATGFATQGGQTLPRGQESRKLPECPSCGGHHWLSRCEKFRKLSLEERKTLVNDKRLCMNCLTVGHYVRSCPKSSFCKVDGCSGKHSTFLHPKRILNHRGNNDEKASEKENKEAKGETASNGYVKMSANPGTTSSSTTGLAIVPVRVKAKGRSETVETYAFLDSGSNTSFCTERLLKKLNHQGLKTKLSLTTMIGEGTPIECSLVKLELTDLNNETCIELPTVYSTPNLPIRPDCIGKQEDVDRWSHLKGIIIPHIDAEIGLLIGSDAPEILQPREVRQSENGGPFATRTVLGWVLNGPLGRRETKVPSTHFAQADGMLNEQFENFCNMEFNDVKYESTELSMSQNDKKALDIMEKTIQIVNGHYEIGLPWKNNPPHLENNRPQAEQRLRSLRKRLQYDSQLLNKYKTFMNDLLRKDYARKVNTQDLGPLQTHWYLPHHPVFHPQKPDKVRVVFDCSAKHRGSSLNDQLLQGPDLTNTLIGVLTRFREEPVAFMADIESMFYQVRVPPSDCDALRFLWWPDGDLDKQPEEYEMRVHLFGGASSPSCANFALKRTAKDNEADFDPKVIETVQRNFYVDDCLKSVGEENEAVDLAKRLRELLARGGFRLTKWLSNSKKVIQSLPESERASLVKTLDFDSWSVERALGVQWNITSDQFGFKIIVKDRPPTRRGILSIVSSVYDPLGFVAPFIFQAKLILQDLCRKKLGWDEPIPQESLERWHAWLQELPKLEKLAVERCFRPSSLGEVENVQLHHFADASQHGYGAVSYLRVKDNDHNVKCSFVMGKARLAPIKPVTIPRLELSAAVVATKLDKICQRELSTPINQSFFWTDSTCVLRYIDNEDKRFQTFVANRVATIHNASSPSQWNYVNTECNPADDASRGVSSDSLDRWITGPDFLSRSVDKWPKRPADMNTDVRDDDPEVKGTISCATGSLPDQHPLTTIINSYSSWSRLKTIVAWVLRYKTKLLSSSKKRRAGESIEIKSVDAVTPIDVSELEIAEIKILKHVQCQSFKEEYDLLGSAKEQDKSALRQPKTLRKSSKIYKLDPMASEGLLRVGGRLCRAPINRDAKHPIILPKNHHVVTLVVTHYHQLSGHSGLEYTLSLIRERYWIIDGRKTIRRILNSCVSCRRRQAPVGEQKMANLPSDRATPSKPPFTFTGVDCFGPFEVRRGRTTVKRYGVLFTCLNVRAIHIEVASSLDTGSFINALRRFISRRGQPEQIRSDNGGNFVKGEKELREAVKEWNQSQIHQFLRQRSIKWTFNPPTGSHHGGVWERCIRTTRKIIRALMTEQVLDDEGISTLMCEVEAIVNGRPITKCSDDPRDMEPLTPNHLLLLRAGPGVPPATLSKQDLYGRRWRQVQYLADVFWRRWIKEYLPSLQLRQKWNRQKRNFQVNDIVLVVDDKTPRNSWPLGRILEVYKNHNDGCVRSVKLKSRTTELVRPVSKIVLLEGTEEPRNDK